MCGGYVKGSYLFIKVLSADIPPFSLISTLKKMYLFKISMSAHQSFWHILHIHTCQCMSYLRLYVCFVFPSVYPSIYLFIYVPVTRSLPDGSTQQLATGDPSFLVSPDPYWTKFTQPRVRKSQNLTVLS